MKVGIIVGSHRRISQSAKLGRAVADILAAQGCEELYTLNLAEDPLPLWDEGVWNGDAQWQPRLSPVLGELTSCDGFVVISPEWGGMVPAALKNLFLFCSKGELAHKPGYIIAVSSGEGGAYPVAELRSSSYKNTRLCYIPEHLIVRRVEQVFNDSPADNDARAHDYLHGRLQFGLQMLCEYAKAFRSLRQGGVGIDPRYPNGM